MYEDSWEDFGMRNLLESCLSDIIHRRMTLRQHHSLLPVKSLDPKVTTMPVVFAKEKSAMRQEISPYCERLGQKRPTARVEEIIRVRP